MVPPQFLTRKEIGLHFCHRLHITNHHMIHLRHYPMSTYKGQEGVEMRENMVKEGEKSCKVLITQWVPITWLHDNYVSVVSVEHHME